MTALEAVVQQSQEPAPTTNHKARHIAPVPGTDVDQARTVADVVSVLIGWLGDTKRPHQVDLGLSLAHQLGLGPADALTALDEATKLLRAWSWSTALTSGMFRPPRYNLTGACVMCCRHGCTSERCANGYRQSTWDICRDCDGTGLNPTIETICNCDGGMTDMTHSEWINRPAPRPPRLNFAGYCLWCSQRWCDNPRCIDRHPRSIWEVCKICDGLGFPENEATCECTHGLVEAEFTT